MFEIATDILQKNKEKIFGKILNVIDLKLEENTLQGNWHPLGFIHIKIGSVENVGDLRLHIWSDRERKTQTPEMPIHNHVFTVNSHILIGKVTNKAYSITNGSKYRIYHIGYNESRSILTPTNSIVDSELISVSSYNKGDFYQVKVGDFHESQVNENEFSATIVLATDRIKDSPVTLGTGDANTEYVYHRMPCEKTTLEGLINKLRSKY